MPLIIALSKSELEYLLARRQARRCFHACFARTRASGAKVVPTTPKGGAAAFDDETLLRESRRRAENPLRK